MRFTNISSMRGAALMLGACATLAACAKKDAGTDSTAMGASTSTTTTTAAGGTMGDSANMAGGATAGTTGGGATMTDADIVARVSAINQGEIDAGNMAKSKATSSDAKSFAGDMVKDHTQMLNDGKTLATKASITPNMASADSITAANKTMGDKLASTAKGTAFDKAYIDGQVMGHQSALANLQAAASAAQNADLKKMLTDAQPKVQKHLDRAKQIQSKMGPTT